MKQIIRKFFAAAMLLVMPFAFSSCEGSLDDVFGKWDNPANLSPKVFMFKNALEKNGTLTVDFTLNDVPSSVTITSDGENFTVTSSTLSASNFKFDKTDEGDMVFLTIIDGDNVIGQIFFKVSDGSYFILNNIGGNVTFDGTVSVNGISGTVTNNCPDKMLININTDADKNTFEKSMIVYYNKANSETWKDVAKRYLSSILLGAVLYPSTSDKTPEDIAIATHVTLWISDTQKDLVSYDLSGTGETPITDNVGVKSGAAFDGPYVTDCTSTLIAG